MTHDAHTRLDELAERCAIAPDYVDIFGQHHVTSGDTKRAILRAMHIPADTDEAVHLALNQWDDARWRRPCDPVLVVAEGGLAARWPFRLPLEQGDDELSVGWEARNEAGDVSAAGEAGPSLPVSGTRTIDGTRHLHSSRPGVERRQ